MQERFKFRIPEFTDKGSFIGFQYVELGDEIECTLCGCNSKPEQCTGLKGKNGKLIYEGDILKCNQMPTKGLCEWFKDGFWVNFFINGAKRELRNMHNWYEVIGNIHENPELLEN